MKSKVEKSVRDLRRITIISFLLMTSHCALLLLGYHLPFAEIVTVCLGFYVVHFLSMYVFKFCMLTRIMLFYNFVCCCCIWIERYQGFGRWLTTARVFMLSVGAGILVALICKWYKKHTWCPC